MKQILFYEAPCGYYGYKTIESEALYVPGTEIRNSDGMTIFVLKAVEASPYWYQLAKKLMSFCRRSSNPVDCFKQNLKRF